MLKYTALMLIALMAAMTSNKDIGIDGYLTGGNLASEDGSVRQPKDDHPLFVMTCQGRSIPVNRIAALRTGLLPEPIRATTQLSLQRRQGATRQHTLYKGAWS